MLINNLKVDRIIVHQIFQRDGENRPVEPGQGHSLVNFGPNAMSNFKSRVVNALGEESKAVPMTILHQGPGSVPALVDDTIEQDDEQFALASYDFAVKLTQAQTRQDIKGGILVIFTGTVGAPAKKFLGIIKADISSGFELIADPDTGMITIEFINDLLLGPEARLYKTAGFFANANPLVPMDDLGEKWSVMLADSQMKTLAHYFYETFLGCGHPDTIARKTKQFYDSANKFIRGMDVPADEKSEILNALITYLKVDTSTTISIDDFSTSYFDKDIQPLFSDYMEEAGVHKEAFTKDVSDITSNLKTRRVKFGNDVKLSAPSEAFQDLITIEPIKGEPQKDGSTPEWTLVTIKDRIVFQG
jgi:hypothetical protein